MIPAALVQVLEQNQAHLLKLVGIVEVLAKQRCSRDSLQFRDLATSVMGLVKKSSHLVAPAEVKELFAIRKHCL